VAAMEEIICCSCGDVFERSVRHKNRSNEELIAKVDASIVNNFKVIGQYWLVPVIASGRVKSQYP
jgi:hypothetical protein